MCLVAWALDSHPRFPWVLASNRDEYFDRPAEALRWWRPSPGHAELLGGRDLGAGGSWLAMNRRGRLALVTNFREPALPQPTGPSRGALVVQALGDAAADDTWLDDSARLPRSGFNLLAAELAGSHFTWVGNRPAQWRRGGSGAWGLSNAVLDTPWPKVQRLKARLVEALAAADGVDSLVAPLWAALADRQTAADAELPATGVPLERERQLSPACIAIPGPDPAAGNIYGTRCSTLVVVERLGCAPFAGRRIHVHERTFDRHGAVSGEAVERFEVAMPR